MPKIVLTTATTAIICFAIAAATGLAARTRSDSRPTIMPVGGYFKVPSIDLTCLVFGSDPTRTDPGPVLYCNRGSTPTTHRGSASVAVSRYHISMWDSGQGPPDRVRRSP